MKPDTKLPWIGSVPKIGIRPTIDGRRRGVRESLEGQVHGHGADRRRVPRATISAIRTARRSNA